MLKILALSLVYPAKSLDITSFSLLFRRGIFTLLPVAYCLLPAPLGAYYFKTRVNQLIQQTLD
ncbi:MAG: hypothetical protein F6K31_18890 [Symploca sp. SIO2G7]|nr:hypothetical protein [Symploca sp. SIO2G7]